MLVNSISTMAPWSVLIILRQDVIAMQVTSIVHYLTSNRLLFPVNSPSLKSLVYKRYIDISNGPQSRSCTSWPTDVQYHWIREKLILVTIRNMLLLYMTSMSHNTQCHCIGIIWRRLTVDDAGPIPLSINWLRTNQNWDRDSGPLSRLIITPYQMD